MPISERIRALERTFGCRICIHDHTGQIEPLTGPGLGTHLNPFCTLVKKREDYKLSRCMHCDIDRLQLTLGRERQPVLKYCHARVCEVVVPVLDDDRIIGIIYAGPFRVEPEAFGDPLLELPPYSRLTRQEVLLRQDLPELTPDIAENCRELTGLLADHIASLVRAQAGPVHRGAGRRELILHFIERNYSRPIGLADLAEHMGLSASRLTQVIKEIFDQTFPALCTDIRIRHACAMLARSNFTVTQIARFAGFGHQAYFHRVFRRHTGMTPLAYRREHLEPLIP